MFILRHQLRAHPGPGVPASRTLQLRRAGRPPDLPARLALWASYGADPGAGVDVTELAEASAGFTPADIRHAAQRVAPQDFESAVASGQRYRASTADYLSMLAATRPTLTPELITEFDEDPSTYARV